MYLALHYVHSCYNNIFFYHYSIRTSISWTWTILTTPDTDSTRHHPGAEVCVEEPGRTEGWSL